MTRDARGARDARAARDTRGAPESPPPWKRVAREEGPDLIVARATFGLYENPRTRSTMRRLVLETPPWVNVVALTPERRLVVVRQYRFGADLVTTEIPGGVVDPGEAPLETARRELREETGYTSERWSLLATIRPNPAFQDNLCHQFLARDARLTHAQEPDPGEDLAVATLELDEVRRLVEGGGIDHSLVLCALARVLDLRRANGAGAPGGTGGAAPR